MTPQGGKAFPIVTKCHFLRCHVFSSMCALCAVDREEREANMHTGDQVHFPAVEKNLYKWVIEWRQNGFIITHLAIQFRAMKLIREEPPCTSLQVEVLKHYPRLYAGHSFYTKFGLIFGGRLICWATYTRIYKVCGLHHGIAPSAFVWL